MCNERDRLIAYIYDECDATERDAVRQHLDGCNECRTEVAGLRSVREDLLAWEVPEHESVWRPFAVAPPRPWWRQVPAWALGAAAAVVLLAGAGGGAVAHAFMAEPSATLVQSNELRQTPVGLTPADLAALEQRLSSRVADQVGALNARVQRVSDRPMPVELSGREAALTQEVAELREVNTKLNNMVEIFLNNQSRFKDAMDLKNAEFQGKLNNMQSNMQLIVSQLGPAK